MNGALIISTREREVWTYENKRHLDRLAHMLSTAGVRLMLKCANPLCPDPQMCLAKDDHDPGGRVLRCGCKDRSFMPKHAGVKH